MVKYDAFLSGLNESPANASPGTGIATVTVDDILNTMKIDVQFTGLTGTTTASHIHCCTTVAGVSTAGVATQTPSFSGFPLGVTSGAFSQTFDLTLSSTYNAAYITGNGGTTASAEVALLAGMAAGKSYLNIHTSTFGGGEIRGFLVAQTPEPATFLLGGVALAGLAILRRRRLTA